MREQFEGVTILDRDPFKHYLYELVMNGDSDEMRGDYSQGTFDMIGHHIIEITPSGFVSHHKMKGHRWAGNLDMWLSDELGQNAAFRVCEMMGDDWQEQYLIMEDGETISDALKRKDLERPDCHMIAQDTVKGWNFYDESDGSLVLEGV